MLRARGCAEPELPKPEFGIFLGTLPKTVSEEALRDLAGDDFTPAELTVYTDQLWTFNFAIAFYHEEEMASQAATALNGIICQDQNIRVQKNAMRATL